MQRLDLLQRQRMPDGAGSQKQEGNAYCRALTHNRLPQIGDEAKNRHHERRHLEQQKDADIAVLDVFHDLVRRTLAAAENKAEQPQTANIRDRETEETEPAIGQGDVDGIEKTQSPQPGQANCRRPHQISHERHIYPALRESVIDNTNFNPRYSL